MKSRFIFGAVASVFTLATVTSALAQMPGPDDPAPGPQANKKIAVGFMQMVFVDHKVPEAFEQYVGANFIEHRPMPGGNKPTRDSVLKGLTKEFQDNPKAGFRPLTAIAEGDLVFVKSDNGDLDVYRVQDGKIVEHWQGG